MLPAPPSSQPAVRRQLTLFLAPAEAALVQRVRWRHNPAQARLIGAHVTLCRDDELTDLPPVLERLRALREVRLALRPGALRRTEEGKGLLIDLHSPDGGFDRLRAALLQDVTAHPRPFAPHLTLLHPRNATCTDELAAGIGQLSWPARFTFTTITLIEQRAGRPWRPRGRFPATR